MYCRAMRSKRRRAWVGFALVAVLAIIGLFVLDGAAAGVTLFVTLLSFIGACMYAARGQDRAAVERSQRSSVGGWLGGWF